MNQLSPIHPPFFSGDKEMLKTRKLSTHEFAKFFWKVFWERFLGVIWYIPGPGIASSMTQATLVQGTICGGDLKRIVITGEISRIFIRPRSLRKMGSDLYLTIFTYPPLYPDGLCKTWCGPGMWWYLNAEWSQAIPIDDITFSTFSQLMILLSQLVLNFLSNLMICLQLFIHFVNCWFNLFQIFLQF